MLQKIKRFTTVWLVQNLLSVGVWGTIFYLSGLWAKQAKYSAYHSYSGDASFIDLKQVFTVIAVARVLQSLIITFLNKRVIKSTIITVAIIESAIWLKVLFDNYGIERTGHSFNVTYGFGIICFYAVLSNLTLLISAVLYTKLLPKSKPKRA